MGPTVPTALSKTVSFEVLKTKICLRLVAYKFDVNLEWETHRGTFAQPL